VIRRLLQQLKAADLINVQRGNGGAAITRPLNEISLLDVYNAVECLNHGELFHFHENPSDYCPVGRNTHHTLDDKLDRIQKAMEEEMKKITIADVANDTQKFIAQEES
jgi:DNA-binding IscR family transcriptional regulator